MILDGVDPLAEKRKRTVAGQSTLTFREVAAAFLEKLLPAFRSSKHQQQWVSTLEMANRRAR
jgi:hypothetical protein